ncbi:MAG: NACHT domain-containing protein [Saprospiraceae bacterium]|nr:NACHT domain-containing protein [Saprospiraceae bacterium]HMX88321.1 NACHT domain-containing protein [Saprospiraceae bacterium]HMZ40395.1 NACHT domain-containing protein [Saprospiraceae bacterium]HNA65411.1 NACHT domain-containing protein [Saprospiraceae bacterium]HNB30895.1 NACHT domain-containing protein [Saprospiraceae bacterium]
MDESKLLEIAFKAFIDETVKYSKSLFSDGEKTLSHLFKKGIEKYLKKQKDRLGTLKTIIQGNTPVFLYDIYFPLKLIENSYITRYHINNYDEISNQNAIITDSISELFKLGSCLTIMGDAGSGKSTLIKHLFLNCIKEKCCIPFLLELRYLNEYTGTIEDFIITKIFEEKIGESGNIIERMLKGGKFVFFLDGYDEVHTGIKDKIIKQLLDFVNEYKDNKFILTSRPYSNIEHFHKFKNFVVSKLNEQEINGFIKKQLPKEEELATKIINSILINRNDYIKSFITNPLLLSLYILTYQTNSDIPIKKYIFYRRVINALFSEHDSKTKIGFRRERKTNLTQEQFDEILRKFSFLTFFESEYEFNHDYFLSKIEIIKSKLIGIKFDANDLLDDLKVSLALWVDDNGLYSFAHRSMQEYYVASFIKRLDNQNKQIIYNKIIQRTESGLTSETENLISLCEEMDTLDFLVCYKLPILESLNNELNDSSKADIIKSILCHLLSGIEINFNYKNNEYNSERPYRELNINNGVYRCLYFDLTYMQSLHSIMREFSNYISANNTSRSKRFNFKLSVEDFPSQVMEYALSKKVDEIGFQLKSFVQEEINKSKLYLSKHQNSNDELVAMIN